MSPAGKALSPRAILASALFSVVTLGACVEDPLLLDADATPGASSPTLDFTLMAGELPRWRDTTYTGFALRSEAEFKLVANEVDIAARFLGLLNVPDTIRTFADTLPVDLFDSVNVRMVIDTIDSSFGGFPFTVRMLELAQGFSTDSASWLTAGPGRPWMTPGGDFGVQLAEAVVTEVADSIVFQIEVDQDSLMKAWQDSDGETGFAFLVEGPATTLNVRNMVFRYDALLEGREQPVNQSQSLTTNTFIVDPPTPAVGEALRVGGLPASRIYLDVEIPQFIEGIPLDGSVINHADFSFVPLPAPGAPYGLEKALRGRQVKLLGDPFQFFEKTPIGTAPLNFQSLEPDSLVQGLPLQIDITRRIVDAIVDGTYTIRLTFRGEPDGQTLGFWEFGSVSSSAALQPRFRIILTPPPQFQVPN
ncbi:MAG: hypothetical protein OEU54_12140 [Gemmatimonadota bacterium]|nr:hypothetical protein [Gemmatimonadota bacterium]